MIETPFSDGWRIVETLPGEAPVEVYRAVSPDGRTAILRSVPVDDERDLAETLGLVRAIDHPNVVRVLDAAISDGLCVIAYEDVAGVRLDSSPVPPGGQGAQDIARWGAQAAAGLEAVHAAGLVHGRIRPSALIVTPDGSVKIDDLGLADALGPADLTARAPARDAYYVSPEEALGRPLLPASDTYSLGVVLYRLATGKAPMGGGDAFAVAKRHADGLVRAPRDLAPAVPVDLERVILRSLSKTPHDRYVTARSMRVDLDRVVAGEPVRPPHMSVAAGRRRSALLPWALVAGVITVVAVLAILWLAGVFSGATVHVPDVTGLPVAEATTRLEDADLTVGELTYDASNPMAVQDTVLSQDPGAGDEVDDGTRVDLVLAGVQPGTVPDVTGMDQSAAAAALSTAGFTLGTVTTAPDPEVAAGLVVGQSPPAGTPAAPGTPVSLTVSSGPGPVPVTTPTPTVLTPTPGVTPTVVTPTPTVLTPTPTSSGQLP